MLRKVPGKPAPSRIGIATHGVGISDPAAIIGAPSDVSASSFAGDRGALFLAAALLIGLLLAQLWRVVIAPPTLWLDEAMLMVNVRAVDWSGLLGPLPYYDQAAPLLYLAALKGVHALAGLSETALRLPSLMAAAGSIALVLAFPRLSVWERLLAAALMAGSDVLARTAGDVKPYTLDLLAACALIAAFHDGARGLLASSWVRGALLLAALTGASSFPLMAFGIGLAFVLPALTGRAPRQWPVAVLKRGWLLAAAAAVYLIYYAAYVVPTYRQVLETSGYAYASLGFAPSLAQYPAWLIGRLLALLASHYESVATVVGLLALAGLWELRRRADAYLVQIGGVLGLGLVLNAARVYPLMEDRFSLFLLPWIAMPAAVGAASLLARVPSAALRVPLAAVGLAALVSPAVSFLADPHHQQARASLAFLAGARETPVVVTIGAQPIYDLYAAHARTESPCLLADVRGATLRCSRLKEAGDGFFAGPATKWYLMNYVAVASWGGAGDGFPGPSLSAFVESYYDWLATEIRSAPRTHLLGTQIAPAELAAIERRLAPHGRLTPVVDERPTSPTRAWGAARVFLYEAHGTPAVGGPSAPVRR